MVAVAWIVNLAVFDVFVAICIHGVKFFIGELSPENLSGLPLSKKDLKILKAGCCITQILEAYSLGPTFDDNSIPGYNISPVEFPLHGCLRLPRDFP